MKLSPWHKDQVFDFDDLCDKAILDLDAKTSAHQGAWGLAESERWDLNQDTGKLTFTFPEKIASCDAQIVGTWNSKMKSWLWAWDNRSIDDALAVISAKLRDYGENHDIEQLAKPKWQASEEDAWLMAALASLIFE